MQNRVVCDRCGWQRDRALPHTERCFVCGCGLFSHVPPTVSDLLEQDRCRR